MTMKNSLISVIMPVYNVDKYIKKCLDSLLAQTYKNFEVICINDSSPDCSGQIVSMYSDFDSRIKLISNDKNIGAGLSRNKGVDLATGDYVLFLDPDDWLEENALEILVKNIDLYNYPDVVKYRYKNFDNISGKITDSQKIDINYTGKLFNPQSSPEILEYWASGTFSILKKEFLISNNIKFNNYDCIEDVEYSIDVISNAKNVLFIEDKILNYRKNREESSSSKMIKSADKIISGVKYAKECGLNHSSEFENSLLRYIYRYMFSILIDAYKSGNLTFEQLKKDIYENVDYEVISEKKLPNTNYHMYLYKRIIGWKKVYFDAYIRLKDMFPIVFRAYSVAKKLLNKALFN